MRIVYRTSGGLAPMPGLQRPVEIDLAQLDEAARDRLRGLVLAANFFELAGAGTVRPASAPRGADLQTASVTVDDGARQHTVQLTGPVPDGPLHELIEAIRAEVRAQRAAALAARAEPPSSG